MQRTPTYSKKNIRSESKSPPKAIKISEERPSVRRLTGEFESVQVPPQVNKVLPPNPTSKIAIPQESRPHTSGMSSGKANISPKKTTFESRMDEAEECKNKAVDSLNASRNTKKEITNFVIQNIERLYKLVCEAEIEVDKLKRDGSKGKMVQRDKTFTLEDTEKKENINKDILNKIAENTQLLKENGKKIEELRKEIERNTEKTDKLTYASVVTASQNLGRVPEREAIHSMVISSEKEGETGEEILEKIRKTINAKEGWVKVERVRKAKDKKIVIGCKTKEERRKIKEKLEKAGQHFVVEDMKNKNPLLILRDVLKSNLDEDIIQALKKQNESLFDGLKEEDASVVVKYRRKARNQHNNHVVLSVSPILWKRAIEKRKLRIDLQRVSVEDQSPLVQCTSCLGYGHSKKYCKDKGGTVELCSHCGDPHMRTVCPVMLAGQPPKCINCVKATHGNCEHNAFSSECPIRKKWDEIARASVAYC